MMKDVEISIATVGTTTLEGGNVAEDGEERKPMDNVDMEARGEGTNFLDNGVEIVKRGLVRKIVCMI